MRLHRLTLTAFGPFGGTQHIDFDRLSAAGLFLLHGPTGAGKTSVLDAICYALYAAVPGARQGSPQALRSDHADPRTATEVVLDLTVGGRRVEVTRRPEQERPKRRGAGTTRDRARSLLREHDPATGTWRAVSHSHQEIGEELTALLGMSRDQFCQVVLLPQGDFARFLRAGAEDRAKLLGRLFDTRRFAGAEAHLAELRAEAVRRVRAGDERLLATAHRVQQAAEPLPGEPADPGEAAAGDPELDDAVLTFAAVARCTARERRDIAAAALRAAESAHAAARRAQADSVELARLQAAHADATARAAARAERGAALDADRLALERAQAAETVAPALRLRDAADQEHDAAALAERRARAALPPALAGHPAAALARHERELRERLGALAAARRAEERARAATAELAALDGEQAAARRHVAEHERRLAPWPGERERLRQAVEAARDAAARADRLAAHLAPAEDRLAAARRRDALAADLGAAEAALLAAREGAADAHAAWLDRKEARLRGIAAELAAGLRPGEPCAVCGSADHPRPARAGEGHVDRAAEEAAEAAHRAADEDRVAAERALAAVREDHAAARAAAGPEDTGELASVVEELRAQRDAARAAAGDEPAARAALAAAERAHEDLLTARQDAHRRIAALSSRYDALRAERDALLQETGRARGDAPDVAARAARLAAEADALAVAADAAGAAEESADRRKLADGRAEDAAHRAGFASAEAAQAALIDAAGRRELRERLDAWQAEEAAIAAVLGDAATADAAARPPADPAAAEERLAAATRRLRAASAAEAAATTRCAELDDLSARAAAEARALAPLRDGSRHITRLAGLTAGTAPENEYRMRLETYVLAARLEQVAAVASVRLHRMSAGRYALVHSDARSGRARSGLGLRVLDAWTGRTRDTATLSGGESFFVSLALALGLADVVAEESGGQRLDTLFIDEGFGSLDEQALDEVLDVLDSLREHDRCVAIVSHVPDLRGRIPAQLRVDKGRRGSTVRVSATPAGT
ncbi:AAA family ATPase [Streptomyces marincola]|uniref:Nuclease SbcCD subunit C n=1 Tax=Streptomyces marincola TaxID=2878388 RepID=A0A1W7D4H0_9ACTN|nr:AAA family ATPase [Streptomyces marincola]ARQ71894.1 ATP-binding cassette family protein [Streptomyces marincola]